MLIERKNKTKGQKIKLKSFIPLVRRLKQAVQSVEDIFKMKKSLSMAYSVSKLKQNIEASEIQRELEYLRLHEDCYNKNITQLNLSYHKCRLIEGFSRFTALVQINTSLKQECVLHKALRLSKNKTIACHILADQMKTKLNGNKVHFLALLSNYGRCKELNKLQTEVTKYRTISGKLGGRINSYKLALDTKLFNKNQKEIRMALSILTQLFRTFSNRHTFSSYTKILEVNHLNQIKANIQKKKNEKNLKKCFFALKKLDSNERKRNAALQIAQILNSVLILQSKVGFLMLFHTKKMDIIFKDISSRFKAERFWKGLELKFKAHDTTLKRFAFQNLNHLALKSNIETTGNKIQQLKKDVAKGQKAVDYHSSRIHELKLQKLNHAMDFVTMEKLKIEAKVFNKLFLKFAKVHNPPVKRAKKKTFYKRKRPTLLKQASLNSLNSEEDSGISDNFKSPSNTPRKFTTGDSKSVILLLKMQRIVKNRLRIQFNELKVSSFELKIENCAFEMENTLIQYNELKSEIAEIYRDFSSSYSEFNGAKEILQRKKKEFQNIIKKMGYILQVRKYRNILKNLFGHFRHVFEVRRSRIDYFRLNAGRKLKLGTFFNKLKLYVKKKKLKRTLKKLDKFFKIKQKNLQKQLYSTFRTSKVTLIQQRVTRSYLNEMKKSRIQTEAFEEIESKMKQSRAYSDGKELRAISQLFNSWVCYAQKSKFDKKVKHLGDLLHQKKLKSKSFIALRSWKEPYKSYDSVISLELNSLKSLNFGFSNLSPLLFTILSRIFTARKSTVFGTFRLNTQLMTISKKSKLAKTMYSLFAAKRTNFTATSFFEIHQYSKNSAQLHLFLRKQKRQLLSLAIKNLIFYTTYKRKKRRIEDVSYELMVQKMAHCYQKSSTFAKMVRKEKQKFESSSSVLNLKKRDKYYHKPYVHPLKRVTLLSKAIKCLKKYSKIQKFFKMRLTSKYAAWRKWEWHLNSSKYLLTLEETKNLEQELKEIQSTQFGVKKFTKNVESHLVELNSDRRHDLDVILKGSVLSFITAFTKPIIRVKNTTLNLMKTTNQDSIQSVDPAISMGNKFEVLELQTQIRATINKLNEFQVEEQILKDQTSEVQSKLLGQVESMHEIQQFIEAKQRVEYELGLCDTSLLSARKENVRLRKKIGLAQVEQDKLLSILKSLG